MLFVQVIAAGQPFYFDPPIELRPRKEEDLWVVKHNELNIFAYAESLLALEEAVQEQLKFLIEEYALESPDMLAPEAANLRKRLRKRLGML